MVWFRTVRLLALLIVGIGVAWPSLGAAVSVQATLDRNTVIAGESVTLQVAIDGGTPQSAETFPAVAGLTIQHTGNQRQINSVNGATTFRFILGYSVTAQQPGKFQIPAIRVVVDGKSFQTQPLVLTATKSDLPQNRDAFVRLLASKTNVYVGEMIPIEVQLYVTSAQNLQPPQLASDGFIVHKQAQHTQAQTQIGQTVYNILSFKMSVSAAKAGKLALGPAEMSFDLVVRTARDPSDPFGFFNRARRQPTKVASPVVEMNVLALPPNAPPEFSGAIGVFNWTVGASPTEIAAGDPVTLRVAVSGTGNLDLLKLPEFHWPDFKFYEPGSSFETSDPLGLQGTKTFEQVVIPQDAGVREIPALTLAYFDPAQKSYVKLSQPAIPLQVRPSAAAAAVPTIARSGKIPDEEPPERTDIVHIKMDTGPMIAAGRPLVTQPWFLVLQGLPLLALAGLTAWRKRQDALAANPRLRRKIQVRQTIQTGLAEARRAAAENRADDFYGLVFRLLQEQLGERLDLPASAITEAVVDERLPGRSVPAEAMGRLHALFRLSNQALYAPARTHAELLATQTELERALLELQQIPD